MRRIGIKVRKYKSTKFYVTNFDFGEGNLQNWAFCYVSTKLFIKITDVIVYNGNVHSIFDIEIYILWFIIFLLKFVGLCKEAKWKLL